MKKAIARFLIESGVSNYIIPIILALFVLRVLSQMIQGSAGYQ